MHYELNVSKDGRHYFATTPRSITTQEKAIIMVHDFRQRFPASQGYAVKCTEICTSAVVLQIPELPPGTTLPDQP